MTHQARWFPWNSLRVRIALVLVGLTLTLGVMALFQARLDLTTILEERLQSRGIAIARDLAARSASPSQTNDIFSLYEAVNETLLNNQDVRYIFLVEPSGSVRVHTFKDGVPPGLADANTWNPGQLESVRPLKTNEGVIRDIAVPVLGGAGGAIHVGMSETGIRDEVVNYIGRLSLLVGIAILVAIALSIVVSSVLTRPLTRVAQAVTKVGGGDFSTKVPVNTADELGDLARAFNSMTEDLVRSRESLVQRNAELEILNSMADNLSQQLVSDQMLSTSLGRLLELTHLSAAWICIRSPGNGMVLAAHQGVSVKIPVGVEKSPNEECSCREIYQTGQARVIPATACPLAAYSNMNGEDLGSCAMVPLWSRGGLVGVLSVASRVGGEFDEARMRLLSSVGRQIGVGLENAKLYEELERKERTRSELLDKLISAQEEERKRIAREIHDEPTQALTGVVLQLDKVERRLAEKQGDEWREIQQVRQRVRGAMESLHQIITELRPQALDDLGFVPAIRWYAEQRLEDQRVHVDFTVEGGPRRLPPAIEVAAFRITQEAINNVAKHARAKSIHIALRFGESAIGGTIEDDGEGFLTDMANSTQRDGAGLGLLGMEERAEILGGSLSVNSGVGKGTRVSFYIPIVEGGANHGQADQGADSRRPRRRAGRYS